MNLALDDPAAAVSETALALAPLAISLRVECGLAATDSIAAACRGWEGVANDLRPPLRLRVGVSRTLSGTGGLAIRVDGSRMDVHGPGVIGCALVDQGVADCAISAEYLNDPAALRQDVLEPLVLMMLTHRDRTPLHASAFIADGLAILLAGRTGAGKSCLARAADAAGYQVLSDDTVFLQETPRLTVWGWPTATHLLARDAPTTAGPTRTRNGTVKQVIPLRSASSAAISCNHAVLCLLSRSRGGEPTLRPASAGAIEERLWPLDEGFDLLPGPIARSLARLSAGGVWDLRLSDDPAEAVRLVVASLPWLKTTAAQ